MDAKYVEACEQRLGVWRKFLNDNPLHSLEDKIGRDNKGLPIVVMTVEDQIKNISNILNQYVQLMERVEKLKSNACKKE